MTVVGLLSAGRRLWWLVLLVVAVCTAAGLVAAIAPTPVYEAQSRVLVSPSEQSTRSVSNIGLALPSLAAEARSAERIELVRRALPVTQQDTEWTLDVTVDTVGLVMTFQAESTDPDVVAPVANFAALDAVRAQADSRLANFSVLEPASGPERAGRSPIVPLIAGFFGGLIASLLILATVQLTRPRIVRPADLEAIGVEPLGRIDPDTGDMEALRLFADRVRAYDARGLLSGIAVAANDPTDHGAAVAVEIADALALGGRPTCVVDADIRSPEVHRLLGVPVSPGLADIVSPGDPVPVRLVPERPLAVLAAGSPDDAPGWIVENLLRDAVSDRVHEGEFVVVSAPPASTAPEAVVAAAAVGSAVVVVGRGRRSPAEVEEGVRALRDAGVDVAGALLVGPSTWRSLVRLLGGGGGTDRRRFRRPARRRPDRGPEPPPVLTEAVVDPGVAAESELGQSLEMPADVAMPEVAAPTRGRTTARNAAYVFMQTGLPPLLNVLLLPILVNQLGTEAYGLFATLMAVFIFSSLFDLGLSKSVVRFTAAYHADRDTAAISRFVSTTFTIYLVLGTLVFLASVLVGLFALGPIGVPDDLQDAAFWACIVFGLGSLYNFPAGTLGGVMGGIKRHDAESRLNIGVAIAQVVGQAVAAFAGWGVLGVVIMFHLPYLVKPFVRLPLIRRFLPGFRLAPFALFHRPLLKDIGGYSGWSFLVESGRRVVESLDPVIISAFIGLSTVTPYSIGLQVGRLLQRMTLPIAFVLLPVASEMTQKGDRRGLERMLLRASRYTTAIAVGLAAPLFILADDVIRVWLREEFPLAVDVARIFLIASVVLMIRAPLSLMLESSTSGVRTAGTWTLIESVVNIALSLTLLHVMGARGVVLATLIAATAVTALGFIPAALRIAGVGAGAFLRQALMPTLLPFAVSLPFWLLISWIVGGRGLIIVLVGVMVATIVFFAVVWRTLTPAERADLMPRLPGRGRRGVGAKPSSP